MRVKSSSLEQRVNDLLIILIKCDHERLPGHLSRKQFPETQINDWWTRHDQTQSVGKQFVNAAAQQTTQQIGSSFTGCDSNDDGVTFSSNYSLLIAQFIAHVEVADGEKEKWKL
jgi:adenylate cyclase